MVWLVEKAVVLRFSFVLRPDSKVQGISSFGQGVFPSVAEFQAMGGLIVGLCGALCGFVGGFL